MQFIGRRQKWSFGGQLGAGFYKEDVYTNKLKAGLYLSISYNYRAIISEKLLIITSLFTGYRDFHYDYGVAAENSGLVGLKAGIVF
jgi:hypothetical protein